MDAKKKKLSLICLVAALLLILGAVAGTLLVSNGPASSGEEISGEIQVSDEETLRQALRSKGDCVITVTEDIVVSRELVVNGNKRLLGASIIMNMHRVGSGESVLAVSKGAVLTLDGATIDGNGVVNCVSVKSGGSFESLTGSLIYGYPYGLDVSGTVSITNIHIDEAMHTAINVAIFGEVDMLGGTISNNVYGIAVAEDARMSIADGVVMDNSYASFIVNYGDMDIAGGKYDGAGDNAIENWGTLSIKGTADKPVEICNGTKSALNSKNKSTLTAEHIKIYDMGWHGMCIEKNSTATLKNIYIDNAGKSSLYVNSSKANMEDVTVIGGAAYAVYGTKSSNVTLKNVTIKDTNHRGIMNEDSTLNAENLVIENTAKHGVYAKGEAVTNINNATIFKPGVSAVAVAGGEANITNVTIENTTKEGISVGVTGKAKIENVTITAAGNFGIANYGGVVEATAVEISDSGNAAVKANDGSTTTANGLVIRNAGKQAISVEESSVATVENCQIDTTGSAAVYVANSTMTMKASTINNAGTYAIAVKDSPKATLDSIQINNPGQHGVGNINSYVLAGNIVVTGAKRCGIYTEGASSVTNMNQIQVYSAGTCGFGFNGGEITARNVKIANSKNEGIYAKAGANVKKLDNVVIQDPGTHGISVENATVKITVDTNYNPQNTAGNGVTVINPGKNGVRCVGGTVSAVGVKIENAQGQGISVEQEGKMTVDGCTIDVTAKAAVYTHNSDLTLKNATINKAGTIAIAAKECKKADGKKVQLSNITIDTTGEQAIANFNSYVLPQNITIQNSKLASVYTEGADSIYNMNQIEIIDAGTCGFGFNGAAEITARNVTITNPKNEGIVVNANTNVTKLDNVTVTNPGTVGIDCQGGVTNITVDTAYNPENTTGNGITITNPGTHGINISKDATLNVTGATVTNAGDRGISSAGTLTLVKNGVTIDGTKGYGIYLTKDAGITGSGLTVRNTGKIGIFSEGASLNISELTLEKTAAQGIQLKGGEVTLSHFTIKENGSAAVRVMNDTKLVLNDGTVYAYNYGIAADGTSNTTVTNVTVERSGKDGQYTTNALVHLAGSAKLAMTETVIDGKYAAGTHEHAGRGVELKGEATLIMHSGAIQNNMAESGAGVAMIEGTSTAPVFTMNGGKITGNYATANGGGLALSNGVFTLNSGAEVTGNTAAKYGGGISMAGGTADARPSFILNGGSFTGNTAAGGADMNCTGGSAKIKLGKALTDPIHVKPNTYADTRLMAEKYGDISDADFESSMALILPDNQNWTVLKTGYLGKYTVSVTTDGVPTMYLTLEEAVAAANASEAEDTITILDDLTVAQALQIDADVTVVSGKTDGVLTITGDDIIFKVAAGKSLTVSGTESAKIAFRGGSADVFYNEGTLSLTHVTISGGKNAINTRANSVLTVTNAVIDGTAEHGINIAGGATVTVSDVSITNTGKRGISSGGTLTIRNVRIETAGDHGVYLAKASTLTGAGLSVKDTVKRGIFSDGASWSLSDITVENAALQGIYLNGGKVTLSNFSVKSGKDAGIYLNNGAQVTLNGGSFAGNTGADIAYGNTAAKILVQTALTSAVQVQPNAYTVGRVMAEKAGSISDADFKASMELLHPVDTDWIVDEGGLLAKAPCEHSYESAQTKAPTCTETGVMTYTCSACGDSYTEEIATVAHTVEHVAEVKATPEAAGNIEYWYCTVCSSAWKDEARTEAVSLQDVVLPKLEGIVASVNGAYYKTLEEALAAATDGSTIQLYDNAAISETIQVDKNLTITADKAVTITADSSLSGDMVSVTGGTLKITGANEDTKITFAATGATNRIIWNNGGSTELTNVMLTGEATGAGIRNEKGNVIATNVVISGIAKDGIHTKSGSTTTLDNVYINNSGEDGIDSYGTIIISNSANPSHALTIDTTASNHGIDVRKNGAVKTSFTNVPEGTETLITVCNTKIGIIIRGGNTASDLAYLHIHSTRAQGLHIGNDAAATVTVTNFTLEKTAGNALEVKRAATKVTLTNGTISGSIAAVPEIVYDNVVR